MPKLNKKMAKTVDRAEAATGSYLMDEGHYAARLLEVNEAEGPRGPYWTWVLGDVHSAEGIPQPGRLWHNTSLSDRAIGFLKAVFDAFEYEPESDTDEMIGEWVGVYVVQQPIASGPKAGQLRNQIQTLSVFDPDRFDFDPEDLDPVGEGSAQDAI